MTYPILKIRKFLQKNVFPNFFHHYLVLKNKIIFKLIFYNILLNFFFKKYSHNTQFPILFFLIPNNLLFFKNFFFTHSNTILFWRWKTVSFKTRKFSDMRSTFNVKILIQTCVPIRSLYLPHNIINILYLEAELQSHP